MARGSWQDFRFLSVADEATISEPAVPVRRHQLFRPYPDTIATGFGRKEKIDDPGEEIDLFGFEPERKNAGARRIKQPRKIYEKITSSDYIVEDLDVPTFLRNQKNTMN